MYALTRRPPSVYTYIPHPMYTHRFWSENCWSSSFIESSQVWFLCSSYFFSRNPVNSFMFHSWSINKYSRLCLQSISEPTPPFCCCCPHGSPGDAGLSCDLLTTDSISTLISRRILFRYRSWLYHVPSSITPIVILFAHSIQPRTPKELPDPCRACFPSS